MVFLPGVYSSFAKSYHGFKIVYIVLLGCTMVLLGLNRIHLDLPGFCRDFGFTLVCNSFTSFLLGFTMV